MRIAVITDVHANLPAMESVVRDMAGQSPDMLVFLGDLVMAGTRPSELVDLMISLDPAIWIKGNTDDWLKVIEDDYEAADERESIILEMNAWAKERLNDSQIRTVVDRPISQGFEAGGHGLTFCHGSPASYSYGILPDKPAEELRREMLGVQGHTLVCGHTHNRFTMRFESRTFVNFGAVSIPGDDYCQLARYGIVDIEKDRVSFRPRSCEYDCRTYLNEYRIMKYPDYNTILAKFGVAD